MVSNIIFEQDEELKPPYTANALINRASNPRLASPLPSIDRGSWLIRPFKKHMTRPQIVKKVAEDLWLTLEERDGLFVFRFPSVWRPKDLLDMQERVLEGIAFFESQGHVIDWFNDFLGNVVAGLRFLFGLPMQRAAEPDLEDAFPLGRSHIVSSNHVMGDYTTREVADALMSIANAGKITLMSAERTDDRYEEPVACYPVMEARYEQ